jgi:STE24 endopeptidase
MLMTVMVVYSLYVVMKLYTSVMQIGYISNAKRQSAVLMKSADFLKAGNYSIAKEKLSIVGTFVEYLLFIIWLGGGISWLQGIYLFDNPALQTIFVVLGFVIINAVVTMPLEWYGKFVLDKEFGFNRSTYALYIKDTVITTVLTIIIGSVIVWGIYLIMTSTQLWWLWGFLFIFGVVILINMLFPTVRALFFDKLTPLEDEELGKKIEELMEKTGFHSQGVFVSDASKRDARLNAYFGGLGKSKRVVLFDTLLEKLSPHELLAVLGHELGHFAHGDIYKNIALVGGMLFVMFAIFGNIPDSLYLMLGVTEQPSVVMVLFLLLMPALSFFMMPVMGMVSRHNEYEADKTGAELGGRLYLSEALKKLVTENKSFPLSHPLYIFFYYTHPPVIERLKALGDDMAVNDRSSMEEAWQGGE